MPAVNSYARYYAIVRGIPPGKVGTYGSVARAAGLPGRARQVGYAMAALPLALNPIQKIRFIPYAYQRFHKFLRASDRLLQIT